MTTLVRDIMTEDPACCTAGTALDTVADLMVEHDCGAIPVVNNLEDRVLVGILTDRDITCRLLAQKIDPLDRRAEHCMTVRVITVGPDASVEACCHVMEENQIRRVVVADNHRRCLGIVSLDDLVQRTDRPNLVAKLEQCLTRPASLASSVPLPLPAKPPTTERTGPEVRSLHRGIDHTAELRWSDWVAMPHELPAQPGLFCVWAAPIDIGAHAARVVNPAEVTLLYIGQADNIAARVAEHEERPFWQQMREHAEDQILFTAVVLPERDVNEAWRKVIKACLVHTHRPVCNRHDFAYGYKPTVEVRNSGQTFGKLASRHTCQGSSDLP